MADKFSYDVFLSHNANDKPRVRRLAERLKQEGLRVWFDEWNIKPGEIISQKIDEGLEQSRVLVLCISPNALTSGWLALERSTAIHRDPANEGRRFVPLLLADCQLPDTLRRYKYVDFREETDSSFAELLIACQPEAAKTQVVKPAQKKKRPTKKQGPSKKPLKPIATLERTIPRHEGWVRSLALSPDGRWIATGSDEATSLWDLKTGEHRAAFREGRVSQIAFTLDSTKLIAGHWNDKLIFIDVKRQEVTNQFSVGSVRSLFPSRDSQHVWIGSFAGSIDLYNVNTKKELKTLSGHQSSYPITSVQLDQPEEHILSSSFDHTVKLWSTASSECLATLKGHSDIVYCVRFMPDGRLAVSGSADKTVKVWNLESKTCVGTFEGHQAQVDSVAISPDGSLVASTGSMDLTVRLWDWKSGSCLQVIYVEESPISVAFSSDGLRLVVATLEGSVLTYRLAKIHPAPLADTTRRYVNAKIVLIGEGTVGKTSLAHRLVEDKYVVRDRTHGMNVWQLELPLAPDDTLEREALLWDLAGQEDYRLIHQLFLDETALALLLVNPQKDDPFAEAGDWLKALKAACGQSDTSRDVNRLLIFSQIDVGGMKLGNAKIERFNEQYGFDDWLATSAKSGENCSDSQNGNQPSRLKQLIASSIPWDKLPWTSTPRLLIELKKAVVAMRDKTDIRLMRFAELTQRLEQALPDEKFVESDVRTAVTLLANHGLARALKFGDLVLLQPELLNGYAGAIIRAARANKDEIGSVLEADIYQPNFDFTGVERLKHRADEELLLRALVQTFLDHSLCIAEDTPEGRQLVFPSQYRREKDIPRDPDIFVSYTFSGEWQTVWTTLVVRLWYSQEFGHKELWRNAAEFASPKGFTLGLKIDNKQGEGTATISLYFDKEVPDDLKAIFIEFVHRHLAKYGCEVSRDRRYVCQNCGNPVKDLDAVRKRLAAKKHFITCQECDEPVVLIDFIEQRLKSDPVARKILAMDETATRALDTQALEQILIGHMMAICGEANQIFRPTTMFDYGIDGEVEFKDDNGQASGKRIYIQLKSGNSYLRTRKSDGSEIFDIKNERHLDYWTSQPVEVYLVIRQTDGITNTQTIRWMNVTRYLKDRADQKSRQIIFTGEKLDMEAVWKVRDRFFPPKPQKQK